MLCTIWNAEAKKSEEGGEDESDEESGDEAIEDDTTQEAEGSQTEVKHFMMLFVTLLRSFLVRFD